MRGVRSGEGGRERRELGEGEEERKGKGVLGEEGEEGKKKGGSGFFWEEMVEEGTVARVIDHHEGMG